MSGEVVNELVHESPADDFDLSVARHGIYRLDVVPNNQQNAQIVIKSGQSVSFTTPIGCGNLAKCYFNSVMAVPTQGANTNLWMQGGCIPMFKTVKFAPQGGGQVLNYDNYNKWSRGALPRLWKYKDFKKMDNTEVFFPSRALGSANKEPAQGLNAPIPYDDIAYAIPIDNGVAAANNTDYVFYQLRIPFSLFVGTPLAMDKNLKFTKQVIVTFILDEPSTWIWYNTLSGNNPAGGTPTALTANINSFVLNNASLYFASITDPETIARCEAEAASGIEFPFDHYENMNQTVFTNAANQNLASQQLTNAMGRRVKRILNVPFIGSSTDPNKQFDICNQRAVTVSSTTDIAVQQFQTRYDNDWLQPNKIGASPLVQSVYGGGTSNQPPTTLGDNGDWWNLKRQYKGSVIQSSGQLAFNFVIDDDFTIPDDGDNYKYNDIDGREVYNKNATYIVQTTCNATATTISWYQFALMQRYFRVNSLEFTTE